jgi:hypothetical protein
MLRLLCALLVVLGAVGCNSKNATSPEGGTNVPCPANVATTSGGAESLTSGTKVPGKICYEKTSIWYVIKVPAGNTLLGISAAYEASANTTVQLDVKVYFEISSTKLEQLDELIAPGGADGGADAIDTTIHAVQPGSYYLQVADAHGMNFDATNAYSLTATYAVDPDSHEPNDTTAQAKPSDTKPGWLAYLGDLDIFETTVAGTNELLTLTLGNPMDAPSAIDYKITDSAGNELFENQALPQKAPFTTTLAVTAPGKYYVTLSQPTNATPSHDPSAAYTLSFGSRSNPDTLDNHTLKTAACPGGGTGPCTMAFSGSTVKLPAETSYISVPGQRDFYRVDVASGAAALLNIKLTSSSATPVKYAVDLLTPDPSSTCMADADCEALNHPCSFNVDDAGVSLTTDCELSHACLPAGKYGFCSAGHSCSLCQGAGLCIPANGGTFPGVCAAPQYLSAFSPMGTKTGGPTVTTTQPLFSNGPYFVNVHDDSYANVDLTHPYTLTLELDPEPDTYDKSTVATSRNNFYNPYPSSMDDQSPNKKRAVDITSQLMSGTPVTGWISYETDNDWFSFQHPCPGMNCALKFTWDQPGPSPVQVAFYMLNDDLSLHESFAYSGMPTTTLTGPVPGTFDNQSCKECSFASAEAGGGGTYVYYLRIADVTQKHWDYTPSGKYTFTVTKGPDGCPSACNQGTSPPGCYCYCASSKSCPGPNF